MLFIQAARRMIPRTDLQRQKTEAALFGQIIQGRQKCVGDALSAKGRQYGDIANVAFIQHCLQPDGSDDSLPFPYSEKNGVFTPQERADLRLVQGSLKTGLLNGRKRRCVPGISNFHNLFHGLIIDFFLSFVNLSVVLDGPRNL